MPIYDRPTKLLMHDFADQELKPGQIFDKTAAVDWFKIHYPNIKPNTVQMHVEGMSVNSTSRKHHPSIQPTSGHDLFYKEGRGRYRLWNKEGDPPPVYLGQDAIPAESGDEDGETEADDPQGVSSREFARENDLRNYLEKNLSALEAGLQLYEEEGIRGVEFEAGGRRIDLLAIDRDKNFVVIELKVSRGHEKVIGQTLRYMAWVKDNMANGNPVRGVIVAREMSKDIMLAASLLPSLRLVEYELTFRLKPIAG